MKPGPATSTDAIRSSARSLTAICSARSRGFAFASLANPIAALGATSPCAAARGGSTTTRYRSMLADHPPPAASGGQAAWARASRLAKRCCEGAGLTSGFGLAGGLLAAPSAVSFWEGLVAFLTGLSFSRAASAEAFSSRRGVIAALAEASGEIAGFARGITAPPFEVRVATALEGFALEDFALAFLAGFFGGLFFACFLTDFLADFLAECFLASFFLADFFAAFFVFFEVFFAISACCCGISPPPNANPGSSQKASDGRSARSGRSFRR